MKLRVKMFSLPVIALMVFLPAMAFSQKTEMTIPDYITKYSGQAQQEMRRTGIPASIKLAQGILESSFGNSRLAQKANNHFGIKCGGNWDGPSVTEDDDAKKECFRKYESVYHSFRDHSNFLIGKERYAALFKLSPKDYKGWANGLQKAGYATNPNYANLLIRLIEERNLDVYDNLSKHKPLTEEEAEYLKTMDNKFFVFNGVKTVISQPNEMAIDISEKYDISLRQLLNYNDLKEGDYIPPGSKIYLQPKKTKGYETYHRVEEGDNMHSISQQQGIKLKSLYKLNLMTWGQEPAIGESLCLKKKCSAAPKLKTDEEIKKDIKQDIQKRVEEAVKEKQENEIKPEPVIEEEPTPQTDSIKEKDIEPLAEKQPEPEVAGEVIEEAIYKPSVPAHEQPRYHKVAPQETIYRISTMYKTSPEDIRKWNGLSSNTLSVGQILIVGHTANLAEEIKSEEIKQPEQVEEKPVVIEPVSAEKSVKQHTVAPKETLFRISTLHGVTVDDLKKWNNLSTNEISIGQILIVGYETETVPTTKPQAVEEEKTKEVNPEIPAPAEASDAPSGQPTYHRVQEGETLFSIAQRHGLNVEFLKKLNNLPSDAIKPGQVLKLR